MTDELDKNQKKDDAPVCETPPHATVDGQDLGLAGNIAKAFINSPVTPMLLVATLLIGIMGLILSLIHI